MSATFIIAMLIFLTLLGHFYIALGIVIVVWIMYSEVIGVTDDLELRSQTRFGIFYAAILMVAQFSLIPGKMIQRTQLDNQFGPDSILDKILFEYHLLLTFLFYVIIIIGMVINLLAYGNF